MMEGLKKRTRKAFGIRKKEKDTDSTGSPDRDGIQGKKKTQKTQLLLTSCFWLRALSLTLSQVLSASVSSLCFCLGPLLGSLIPFILTSASLR